MADTKKKFEVKNWLYLSGPLALVAFFLMDYIGGMNYPGYNWVSQVVGDLLCLNSYSFVISIVFCAFYVLLSVIALYCSYKFLKAKNIHKKINRGLFLFVIAALLVALSTIIFLQPDPGVLDKVKGNAQIEVTQQKVMFPGPNQDQDSASSTSAASSDSADVSSTGEVNSTTSASNQVGDEVVDVISIEKTASNFEQLGQTLIENPLVIGTLACSLVAIVLAIIGLILIAQGGFKKDGYIILSVFAIFCCVLIAYSAFAVTFLDANMIGLNSRFGHYAFVIFTAFLGAYVYITNVEE